MKKFTILVVFVLCVVAFGCKNREQRVQESFDLLQGIIPADTAKPDYAFMNLYSVEGPYYEEIELFRSTMTSAKRNAMGEIEVRGTVRIRTFGDDGTYNVTNYNYAENNWTRDDATYTLRFGSNGAVNGSGTAQEINPKVKSKVSNSDLKWLTAKLQLIMDDQSKQESSSWYKKMKPHTFVFFAPNATAEMINEASSVIPENAESVSPVNEKEAARYALALWSTRHIDGFYFVGFDKKITNLTELKDGLK